MIDVRKKQLHLPSDELIHCNFKLCCPSYAFKSRPDSLTVVVPGCLAFIFSSIMGESKDASICQRVFSERNVITQLVNAHPDIWNRTDMNMNEAEIVIGEA